MMVRTRIGQVLRTGILVVCGGAALASFGWAQAKKDMVATAAPANLEGPDAQHTQQELANLFQRYPPSLRNVLALDPSLLSSQTYLQPYPTLVSFLREHPEVARDPSFYIGAPWLPGSPRDSGLDIMEQVLAGLAAFAAFAMAIGLIAWLIRTLVDYKRWSRLAKVQTEAHTKLLDRFAANEDLLAYIKSPAGSKFLESSPIALDAAPRSVGAPFGRILWSVQGGAVLMAAGIGLQVVGANLTNHDA